MKILIKSGEPCHHKGCLQHITHPCEYCGRIAGKGEVKIFKEFLIHGLIHTKKYDKVNTEPISIKDLKKLFSEE